MSAITGAELLLRCLAAEGVTFMFGLPCPEVDPILAKLDEYGVRFVPVRHEAAAVHMAEGLYKTSGQVAVVLGNPGPGSANLLPGVITARHEGVPVVVFTAQHRLANVILRHRRPSKVRINSKFSRRCRSGAGLFWRGTESPR
jgi:acetolactate synthase I/II/III large subunit